MRFGLAASGTHLPYYPNYAARFTSMIAGRSPLPFPADSPWMDVELEQLSNRPALAGPQPSVSRNPKFILATANVSGWGRNLALVLGKGGVKRRMFYPLCGLVMK